VTENEPSNSKYAVPAIDKAFEVLEYLSAIGKPLKQSEIAVGLNRNLNEIYRVLVALVHRGYLLRDEQSGRYRLSLKLYNLSHSISPVDQLRQCALPLMEDLAVEIGMSCHLSVLYQSKTMVLVQARSHSSVSLNITEGALFSTRKTISGKVLLANSNDAVRAMILERDEEYQTFSQAKQKAFIKKLNTIKNNGYLGADSEITKGVYDFSALVGQPEGKVVAALSMSALNTTFGNHVNDDYIKKRVIETALQIATQLGY
jgi:DNA-binding IclR family transcriptional regulator